MADPTPKIIQLAVMRESTWDHEGREVNVVNELLGLDDRGVVWKRGKDGWEPHTAGLTGAP